jgi:phosphinothricin acetyltransferase
METLHKIKIRGAEVGDAESITEIYNDEILHGTATFDTDPKTVNDRIVWLDEHTSPYFVLVAEIDGKVVGFCSLSSYRPRKAFDITAELSLYIAKAYRGLGIGTKLMQATLTRAKQEGKLYSILSLITSTNTVSVALHNRFGFTLCGTIPNVGYKFSTYLSLSYYQYIL